MYYNELELFLEISMYLDKRNIEVYRIQRLEFVMEWFENVEIPKCIGLHVLVTN